MGNNNTLPTEVQEQIFQQSEDLYNLLDEKARDYDHYEYGLPMFEKCKEPIERLLTEYATKYHHLQHELVQLQQWKKEATELLAPILDYGQGRAKLGTSCTEFVLERCKQYDEERKERVHLDKENDLLKAKYDELKHNTDIAICNLSRMCDNAQDQAKEALIKRNELKAENERLNDDLMSDAVRAEYGVTGSSYSDLLKEHAALKERAEKMIVFFEKKIKDYGGLVRSIDERVEQKVYKDDWVEEREAKALSTVWKTHIKHFEDALSAWSQSKTNTDGE